MSEPVKITPFEITAFSKPTNYRVRQALFNNCKKPQRSITVTCLKISPEYHIFIARPDLEENISFHNEN
jgi:hypothetical protein